MDEYNNNIVNLVEFLKNHEVEKDAECTHTIMGNMFGLYKSRYYINDKDNSVFLNLYKKVLVDCINSDDIKESPLHIVERPKRVGPILVDLDFRQKSMERKYSLDNIKYIISKYNKVIKKYINTSTRNIKAFVFEKSKPTYHEESNYKDGFHIIYPDILIDASLRYKILEEVQQIVTDENGLAKINYINTDDEVFDKSIVLRNGWMLYGSRKPNNQEYKLTHIYYYGLDEEDINHYDIDELVILLSVRAYDPDEALGLNKEYNTDEFRNNLQNIYDKYHNKTKTERTNKEYDKLVSGTEKIKEYDKPVIKTRIRNNDEIGIAKRLTELLSKERAYKYETWIHVGWALHNIDDSLLDCFITFSKKCPQKYQDGCCEKVWRNASICGFTIASLYWWAKEDNPNGYADVLRDNVKAIIAEAETGSHDDIAKVIYELYKYYYRCASIKKNIWYEFQGHHWVLIDSGYTLQNKISDEVTTEFAKLASQYFAEAVLKTGLEKDNMMAKAQKICKIVSQLKNENFKNSLLSSCSKRFYESKFEERLDDNPYLVGLDNGVYDLKNRCFRAGVPDDYITLSVGYNYEVFNHDDDKILEIEDFFKKVQREDDMRIYILKLIASYLCGNNIDQHVIIWTGSGGNGKSKTIDLIKYTFGALFDILPITILTRKRTGCDNATPALANKRGKRFLALQEPDHDDVIYVGLMKELSGSDFISARALYGEPFTYKPQFKLVLTCNKLPSIPSDDGGTWRRLRVSPWESEFVDNPKLPNQYAKDPKLDEKIKEWKQGFLWLLVNVYYPLYCDEGLKEPKKVTQFTDNYKKNVDIYFEFLTENITITQNDKDYESITNLYTSFVPWFKFAYPGMAVKAKKEFVTYISSRYKVEGNRVLGMKFNAGEVSL